MADNRAVSALPSVKARLLAALGIAAAAIAGALIAVSLVELQCEGDCTTYTGIGIIAGAGIAAAGASVVAVMVFRAMSHWSPHDPDRASL